MAFWQSRSKRIANKKRRAKKRSARRKYRAQKRDARREDREDRIRLRKAPKLARIERRAQRDKERTARVAMRQNPENVAARQEALASMVGDIVPGAAAVGASVLTKGAADVDGFFDSSPVDAPYGDVDVGGFDPLWIAGGIAAAGALYLILKK
jgi:hypothetical protein